ncbi:hypothetical protein A1C_03115 [Rickettsia akari str. Hartford]|uniref:Uncharacterized protein n=1 Tax=Rickettsia akari (strain Hartford) TaxID=293614 RepID=A8GND4_RICAH|nr:TolC family protein [Rickettsia akari]ABV74909.1 hypothetical protein A1C_03115 [Rickettsia akari str. Hartford]
MINLDYFPALPVLPKILPSELLGQRLDIKAAEQNLLAADANLKAIKATYFMQISLTGLLGLGSNKLNTLFTHLSETGCKLWMLYRLNKHQVIIFGPQNEASLTSIFKRADQRYKRSNIRLLNSAYR